MTSPPRPMVIQLRFIWSSLNSGSLVPLVHAPKPIDHERNQGG